MTERQKKRMDEVSWACVSPSKISK